MLEGKQVCVYSGNISLRLRYAADFIFGAVIQVPHLLTDDPEIFKNYLGPRVCYAANTLLGNCIHITPFAAIFEEGLPQHDPDWLFEPFEMNTSTNPSRDIFYYVFFHLARIEEYRTFDADVHGRFTVSNSRARHLIQRPFLDMAVRVFADAVQRQFPTWQVPPPTYRFQPTLDLDNTFAYLAKGYSRTILAMCRDIARAKFSEVVERFAVLTGLRPDPYQTFDWQKVTHRQHGVQPLYFFLLGRYGAFDKMPDYRHPLQKNLLRDLADSNATGLHPSYRSNTNPQQLEREIAAYRDIVGIAPTHSRQHYLKLQFPETYRRLIAAGITHDYSVLFAEVAGFRSGTAHPHLWFDVLQNKPTALTLHPSCVMDVTLKNYMKLSPDQAIERINSLVADVRTYGGTLISVWHNDTLTDRREWHGWRRVYEYLLATAAPSSAD